MQILSKKLLGIHAVQWVSLIMTAGSLSLCAAGPLLSASRSMKVYTEFSLYGYAICITIGAAVLVWALGRRSNLDPKLRTSFRTSWPPLLLSAALICVLWARSNDRFSSRMLHKTPPAVWTDLGIE